MVPMGACFEDFSYRETGDEKFQTLYKDPVAPRPHTDRGSTMLVLFRLLTGVDLPESQR
jgi:hypothetical protein